MLRFIPVMVSLWGGTLLALPTGPGLLCQQYPDSPLCVDNQVSCNFCHTTPPQFNDFGSCLKSSLEEGDFTEQIPLALNAIEDLDCDKDGASNLEEILAGTFPGDENSFPDEPEPPQPCDGEPCEFSPMRSWKKIHQDICGQSPDFDQIQLFKSKTKEQKLEAVTDTLEQCLDSEYWLGKEGVVWSLAHTRIRPTSSLKSGDNTGSIPLGDYDDDYNLFVYYHTDNRDIRGLITAQHYVVRQDLPTVYTSVPEQPLHPKAAGLVLRTAKQLRVNVQQFVPRDKRAGLLTTLYTSVSQTMFTPFPRTTAAHAMRHYLGLDIARAEGLSQMYPKNGDFELIDYDNKGILDPACEFCHRALDGIATLWTPYNGISTLLSDNNAPLLPGMYGQQRMAIFQEQFAESAPIIGETPSDGYAFGTKVDNLVDWAETMANTDEYAKKVVHDYWHLFFGSEPKAQDMKEFERLWKNLKDKHAYSVERMIHEMVFTNSFGRS